MTTLSINPPYPVFTDVDGNPLNDGYLYFGLPNQNPETSPIAVYWDPDLTIPAVQPIRTSGGYPVRNGTPSRIYAGGNCSVTVRNKNGSFIYSSASTTDFASASNITYKAAGTNTQTMTVAEWMGGRKSLWDYVPPGTNLETADCSVYIQAALDDLVPFVEAVELPDNQKLRINKPIYLRRGRSLFGNGCTDIIADFNGWTDATGDKVALKFIVDESPTSTAVEGSFGPLTSGFRLIGQNNAGIISTGAKFFTTFTIAVGVSVNYAYIAGCIQNLTITKFDTAMEFLDCWNTNFWNIQIAYCRRGINVAGKSVNNFFTNLKVTNPTNDNTSSVANTIGVEINSGFYYSGGAEGRPEGFTFVNGLIFGHYYNVLCSRGLQIVFADMILDGAAMDCVSVGSPDLFTVRDCYIFTAGTNGAGVRFTAVGTGNSAHAIIADNYFVGVAIACSGVVFDNAGAAREDIQITGNTFTNWTVAIDLTLSPIYSKICNNHGDGLTQFMVYLETGGQGTLVDGNTTTTDIFPLVMHPTSTSEFVQVGYNKSPNNSTYYEGRVVLPAGSTSIALPNDFYTGSTPYVLPLTTIASLDCAANPGVSWYQDLTSWSAGTFKIAAALAFDLTIRYTVKGVSYQKFY